MSIFLTSDTHFGHENIIRLAGRPFGSASEMDDAIISRWNDTVGRNDEVWHLGDFAHGSADVARLFSRLNGRKHLIRGNHDHKQVYRLDWLQIEDLHEIRQDDRRLIICRYPLAEWNGFYRGAIHAHGHQHNKHRNTAPRRFDVGVDANGFRPVAIEELFAEGN